MVEAHRMVNILVILQGGLREEEGEMEACRKVP